MTRMGSSADTLVRSKPAKHNGAAGRILGASAATALHHILQPLPAVVPSVKPGACQAGPSIPEGPEAADNYTHTSSSIVFA